MRASRRHSKTFLATPGLDRDLSCNLAVGGRPFNRGLFKLVHALCAFLPSEVTGMLNDSVTGTIRALYSIYGASEPSALHNAGDLRVI